MTQSQESPAEPQKGHAHFASQWAAGEKGVTHEAGIPVRRGRIEQVLGH